MNRLRPWLPHLLWLYALIAFGMLVGWSVNHINIGGKNIPSDLSAAIMGYASIPSQVYYALRLQMENRLVDNSSYGDGFEYHADVGDLPDASLLIPSFEGRELVVFWKDIRSGRTRHAWRVKENFVSDNQAYVDVFPGMGHPLMLKDSSLVFVSGILCRLDKNSKPIWINNRYHFHHALEPGSDSLLWTSVRLNGNPWFNHGGDTLLNEGVASVDLLTGKVLFVRSVADILVENGYRWLLEVGPFEKDLLHINDVEPARRDGPFWNKGDLLVSIRNRNTVMLYRPSTDSILWLQTGPWMGQHDPDFVGDSTIMIYGNDIIRGRTNHLAYGHNDIYLYHLGLDTITKPYTRIMARLGIDTPTEGRCDFLPNGDLLIDETDRGMVYILNTETLKATYAERYDKDHLKILSWVRSPEYTP